MKIKDLKPKDEIQSIYMVKYIGLMEARDGRSYLNVIMSDNSGDIEARLWQNAEETYSKFERGSFASVTGRINNFQGRLQLIIQDITLANTNEYNPDDFIKKSSRNPQEMFSKIVAYVENLKDVYIKELLLLILQDKEISNRLQIWPAGKSIHHNYQSGLLEHILSCTEIADFISHKYNANSSYVIAGSILHDLGKVFELSNDLLTDYTDEGKLIGHSNKGVELLNLFSNKINNFPNEIRLHLNHILLSHHGEYEHGASKLPQTKEALIIHLIDLMDSKINSFETAIESDKNTGSWTSYIKHLDRVLYKNSLPTYTSHSQEDKKSPNKKKNPELKQNLGTLLKNFEIKPK